MSKLQQWNDMPLKYDNNASDFFQGLLVTNLLRCLKLGPYLSNNQGMGSSGRDRKANTLPAQWTPSFSYI